MGQYDNMLELLGEPVQLVLVSSRELREDLCQYVLNTGVVDDTEVVRVASA